MWCRPTESRHSTIESFIPSELVSDSNTHRSNDLPAPSPCWCHDVCSRALVKLCESVVVNTSASYPLGELPVVAVRAKEHGRRRREQSGCVFPSSPTHCHRISYCRKRKAPRSVRRIGLIDRRWLRLRGALDHRTGQIDGLTRTEALRESAAICG